jgi:hypothetical protein
MDDTKQALIMAVLTGSTCGEACWHAAEDVCRCSCGGKNHGILKNGGERPERTCKIQGRFYRLGAVGTWLDIRKLSHEYNVPNGDYSKMRRIQAVDKPPSNAQKHWPEVVNSGVDRPHMLWLPVQEDSK